MVRAQEGPGQGWPQVSRQCVTLSQKTPLSIQIFMEQLLCDMYCSWHGGNKFPALIKLTFFCGKRQSVNTIINTMLKNESAMNI